MQRSGSQKVLLVVSIITIVAGVLSLLMSIMAFVGGGLIGGAGAAEVASLTQEVGMSQGEIAGLVIGVGIAGLLEAILYVIEGILGIRASKDATKIGPVRFLTILSVVLGVAGIAIELVSGNSAIAEMGPDFITLALNCFMLWICNNIKSQAMA